MARNDARAIIKWLESPEGRRWSRSVHLQGRYAVKWFSLKPEIVLGGTDMLDDVVLVDLGRYDRQGQRFYRKPKPGCNSYYQS